ncbi:hypothetical protein [Kitasatospora fiedleri]|uniref:hypothetical protein n=1 Tax=Kitasatospora fiedleri TaxID=2991545 RepID=UPI00249C81EF|nr:hypothetical protein [Kitasatospora fiedleri]
MTADDVRAMDPGEQMRFLLRVVDREQLSPAMTDALTRIGTDLSSWPQLASGVMLVPPSSPTPPAASCSATPSPPVAPTSTSKR